MVLPKAIFIAENCICIPVNEITAEILTNQKASKLICYAIPYVLTLHITFQSVSMKCTEAKRNEFWVDMKI